jgi:hypothetical protein
LLCKTESNEGSMHFRPGALSLAIFETWETKSSGTLARRFAEGITGLHLP